MGTVGAGEAAGAGAVTTARGGRGRGIRGGVLARCADGRGSRPGSKLSSTSGDAVPVPAAVRRRVRVKMSPDGVNAVGGAGSPGGERADADGSVIAAESAACEG